VDIVWYRNPIDFFHDQQSPIYGFDIYFQEDGNKANFYAPYSANSGFYYVRSTDLTKYLFTTLLLQGDAILAVASHQIPLSMLLAEFASLYNLKVKVLSGDDFPGGFAFHTRKQYMKTIFTGEVHPYIFHMSWTDNKHNKKLFIRQMGDFYVNGTCVGSTADQIRAHNGGGGGGGDSGGNGSLLATCCSKEAIFSCHYMDVPSREPCPNAPLLNKNTGKSFW